MKPETTTKPTPPSRLRVLLDMFDVSLGQLSNATGRAVSKSQIHGVVNGQRRATPRQKQAMVAAVVRLLNERVDSSYLFATADGVQMSATTLETTTATIPFKSDRDAWSAGYVLIARVREMRAGSRRPPDDDEADMLIREYCTRLRRSRTTLTRMMKAERLTNADVVCVVYAVAYQSGVIKYTSVTEMARLAVGFDPLKLRKVVTHAYYGTGVGRLVQAQNSCIWPTKKLLDWSTAWTLIADHETEELKLELERMTHREDQ